MQVWLAWHLTIQSMSAEFFNGPLQVFFDTILLSPVRVKCDLQKLSQVGVKCLATSALSI